jgi:hypothetical protein
MRHVWWLLVLFGFSIVLERFVVAEGEVLLPPKGSSFTYKVVVEGKKAATMTLWEEPGTRLETHTFLGIVKGFRPQIEGLSESLPVRDCIHWMVTRPGQKDYRADFYYALESSSIRLYFEQTSDGGMAFYEDPLPVLVFPFKAGKTFSGNSAFYLRMPDTGMTLMHEYRSKDLKSDTIEGSVRMIETRVANVEAGAFQCMNTLSVFQAKTGRLFSSARTKVEMERFWSEDLRYFVKEHSRIRMDAMIDSEGTIERELIKFSQDGTD